MTPEHELVLERIFDAPVTRVFKAWTTPDILMRWWCPPPWRVTACEIDLRPGGRFNTVMEGPDGAVMENKGSVLEVIPDRRLVFTDALAADWVPVGKPFMVGHIEFEDLGGVRTRYTGKARHWSAEDKANHEQMGFSEGWGIAADQLAALLPTL